MFLGDTDQKTPIQINVKEKYEGIPYTIEVLTGRNDKGNFVCYRIGHNGDFDLWSS